MKRVVVEFSHLSDVCEYSVCAVVEVKGDEAKIVDMMAEDWHGGEPSTKMMAILEEKTKELAVAQTQPE